MRQFLSGIQVADNGLFNKNLWVGRPATTPTFGIDAFGGAFRLRGLAIPSAPTVAPQGATGSTIYIYAIVAKDTNGNRTNESATTKITNGNATLSGANFNRITWSAVTGAVSYDVLKDGLLLANTTALTLDDTGQTATAYTLPTHNETGDLFITTSRLNVGYTADQGYDFATNGTGYFASSVRVTDRLDLWDSSAATNNHLWNVIGGATQLQFQVLNDAASAGTSWLVVQRSTTTPTLVNFSCTGLQINYVANQGYAFAVNGTSLFSGLITSTNDISTTGNNGARGFIYTPVGDFYWRAGSAADYYRLDTGKLAVTSNAFFGSNISVNVGVITPPTPLGLVNIAGNGVNPNIYFTTDGTNYRNSIVCNFVASAPTSCYFSFNACDGTTTGQKTGCLFVNGAGMVGVNVNPSSVNLQVAGTSNSSGDWVVYFYNLAGTYVLTARSDNQVLIGSLGNDGPVYSHATALTNVNPSGRIYKTNERALEYDPKRILALQPKMFTWKERHIPLINGNKHVIPAYDDFGLVAEDVREVLPELYVEDEHGAVGYRHEKLVFYLLEVLKGQEDRLARIEDHLAQPNK